MTGARAAAFGVLVLGVSGAAGTWPALGGPLVLVSLLLVPGYALSYLLCEPYDRAGPQGLAIAVSLSIAVFNVAAAITAAIGAGWSGFSWIFAGLCTVLAVAATRFTHDARLPIERTRHEWLALLLAAAVLLPAVWKYAGGGVDDWWDLAYVRALADRRLIDFSEPMLGTGRVHPRFSWSSWLLLQAAGRALVGSDPVMLQWKVLAPVVCVASVTAVLSLARAVFAGGDRKLVVLAVIATPAWIFGTDALPYFTRLHQDKFVAALVLMPVLLATALDYVSRPTARRTMLVACTAMALCSVHTLVFGVASLGVLACSATAYRNSRERRGWCSVRSGAFGLPAAALLCGVLALVMLPPLWQAWALRSWFAGQGVGLATPDNPVVRAHLALDRLVAAGTPYMIVNPGALFGPLGLVVALGACLALRRKSAGDSYLLTLTFVPAAIIFLPLVAAGVGAVTVPWMLYRIGWLVPQPLLLARVFVPALRAERWPLRTLGLLLGALVVLALSAPTAADRLRREMREHPFSYETFPRGTTLAAYRFLDRAERPGAVLAPQGFSNLIPAMTGRPVVAFSERGTLVFSGNEFGAYARLSDRATFFSCSSDAESRKRIADGYGVAYAVFRRRYRTQGDEMSWLERATADGVLLAGDASLPVECAASEARLAGDLPAGWRIVFANADYFIVETDVGVSKPAAARDQQVAGGTASEGRWLEAVGAQTSDASDRGDVLASATASPGGVVVFDPVPAGLGIGNELLWAGGGALWDDGPVEIMLELSWSSACPVSSIEILPYLETRRREVFEVRIEDRVRSVQARDGTPIRIALERASRASVRVGVRSRLGLPFGIADVRVVGERGGCVGGWRPLPRPQIVGLPLPLHSYFTLASDYPRSPRAALDFADHVGAVTSPEDAIAILRRGLSREPGQAAGWIDLGLRLDAAGRFDEALDAYRQARAVDSNSAWAHGCLAWAGLRAGWPVTSLWHAWRAVRLDSRYADAVTIAGLALERLGGDTLSARALNRAMKMAPRRGWPYLERARQLAEEGRREDALALLRRYREIVPDDAAATEMIRSLAGDSASDG